MNIKKQGSKGSLTYVMLADGVFEKTTNYEIQPTAQ